MDSMNSTNAANVAMTTADPLEGYPFPSRYPWWHIIGASVIVTFIIALIVLGNGLVIVAIVKDKNLKQLQNWFIASLAVSDLLLGLLIMPFSLANELMGYWYFGELLCEMWLSIDVLLCTASILNLCLISLDRYWSITRAVSYVKHRTKKKATLMITIVWVLSAIICFPPLVGWKRPTPPTDGFPLCVLSQEIGYVVYSTLGSFFIPLMVMVVVYFKIYLAARARARRHLNKNKCKAAAKKNGNLHGNGSKPMTLTTTHVNTSFTKLHSVPGTDVSHDSPDLASLSASESCQEAILAPTEGVNGRIIQLHPIDREKHNGKPAQCVCNKGAGSGGGTLEERRKLLCDDTDRTESESEMAPHRLSSAQYELVHNAATKPSAGNSDTVVPAALGHNGAEMGQSGPNHVSNGSNQRKPPPHHPSPVISDHSNAPPPQCTGDCNSVAVMEANCEPHMAVAVTGAAQNHTGSVPYLKVTQPYKPLEIARKSPTHSLAELEEEESTTPNGRKNLLSPSHCNNKAITTASSSSSSPKAVPKSKKRTKDLRKAANEPERLKRKIARARERRATLVLGIIMATFILCWLPFFGTYLISTLAHLTVPEAVFAIMFWAGYCNSALNPMIYTIFNQDFRKAFQKLLFGRRYR